MGVIHGAENRTAAVPAATDWICRHVGAQECRFIEPSLTPAEPDFSEEQWLIPAYVGDKLVGGLALDFGKTSAPVQPQEEFLRLCAEILVFVDRQADAERQAAQITRRFLQLEEAEKRRIGRDLHDNSAQQLAVVRLQMEMLQMSPKEGDELFTQLAAMREVTEKTISDVRRLIADLSPSVLEQLGLMAAIRQLGNRFATEFGCEIQIQPAAPLAIDADAQLTVYRLIQSAFRYLTENLGATHLNLSMAHAEGVLGLTLEGTVSPGRVTPSGEALDLRGTNLWDRVVLLGGSITSEFSAESGGVTQVLLNLQIPDLAPTHE
jgi:signal transduction histidine kinase